MKNNDDIEKLLIKLGFIENYIFVGEWYKSYNGFQYEFVGVKDFFAKYIELRKYSTTTTTETIFSILHGDDYEEIYNALKNEFKYLLRKDILKKITE